ncbi:MAG: ABC transporter ATP-binding protein [Lachnospiraceae bacterium]|jgi:putative spermidine/putrescine transport system ATP-binding protein|nr:ABC transporter ATP-binding protein [Lachnospiraceae bacterium]
MSYIEFRNVVKRFGDATVLDHLTFSVRQGDLVTLLGPSGCGKSTLLRCLAGLETVTEGKIFLDGTDITDLPSSSRNIGMVFQQYSLFPNMNVEQNIGFGLKMEKCPPDEIRGRVRDAVALVELEGKEKAYPASLSGGQQQRVALARAVVMRPKVLLLDEPLSAIDAKLRKSLQQRIREIHKELGLTTIFVTHDQDEAMVMSDMIQLFHAGRIEQAGTPISVYTAPVSVFAAGFMGSYNQIDGAVFSRLSGMQIPPEDMVAIRPETISLSREKTAQQGCCELSGTVLDSTPRGNVLRYRLQVEDTEFRVDVLFRSFHLFQAGERLWLTIPERDCLRILKGAETA